MPASHVESLSNIESGYWWYEGRIHWASEMLKEAVKDPSSLSYADIGCGTGGFASQMKQRFGFTQALLVDADPAVLTHARKHPGFEVLQADLEKRFEFPFNAQIISCMDVLEHVKDDHALMRNMAEQLPKGGVLIASVPAFPALYSEWDRQLGHHRRYTKHSLTELFEASGLKIRKMRFMWSFLFPAAPVRLLKTKRYQSNMEFEKASPWVNKVLSTASRAEYRLAHFIKFPFGTSLICLAEKP